MEEEIGGGIQFYYYSPSPWSQIILITDNTDLDITIPAKGDSRNVDIAVYVISDKSEERTITVNGEVFYGGYIFEDGEINIKSS